MKIYHILGLIATGAMVSCYPPQDPRTTPTPTEKPTEEEVEEKKEEHDQGLSEEEQKMIEEFRKQQGANNAETSENVTTTNPQNEIKTTEIRPTDTTNNRPKPPTETKNTSYPFADPVPNKPGYVFNPYTQKQVDVRGVPSGALVSDPRNANHKFYVP